MIKTKPNNKFLIKDIYWVLERFCDTHFSKDDVYDVELLDLANAILILAHIGFGDIYFIEDFIDDVRHGGITNYDGIGDWVDDEGNSLGQINCNVKWLEKNKPENAKFIMWYNK